MKKISSIAITMILLSSILLVAVPTRGVSTFADVEPVDWQSGLAGSIPMPTLTAEDYAEGASANAFMSIQILSSIRHQEGVGHAPFCNIIWLCDT